MECGGVPCRDSVARCVRSICQVRVAVATCTPTFVTIACVVVLILIFAVAVVGIAIHLAGEGVDRIARPSAPGGVDRSGGCSFEVIQWRLSFVTSVISIASCLIVAGLIGRACLVAIVPFMGTPSCRISAAGTDSPLGEKWT